MYKRKKKSIKILDCESVVSTYHSLEIILEVKKDSLCHLFDSINIYDMESCKSYCDFLFQYIKSKTHCKIDFDEACWFHATRTWQDNNYIDGLLPTKLATVKIMEKLNYSKEKIQRITDENSFICNSTGGIIVNKISNGGPFGFLIRNFAFVQDDLYVQYFRCPEIVEDLGLKDSYLKDTVPCIVKFITPIIPFECKERILGTAVLYAYREHRNLGINHYELTYAFDGKNVPVLKQDILKVEFIETPA